MSSTRRTVACATALALLMSAPAFAAKAPKLARSAPLTVEDPAGDANGINSQGGLAPIPSQTGQGGRTAADITKLVLARTDNKKAATGLTVALTLGVAPDQATSYQLRMATADCSTFWVVHDIFQGGATETYLRDNCSGTATNTPLEAKVTGTTIVWTLPLKSLPIKLGTELKNISMQARGLLGAPATVAAFPVVIDEARTDKTYKIGA